MRNKNIFFSALMFLSLFSGSFLLTEHYMKKGDIRLETAQQTVAKPSVTDQKTPQLYIDGNKVKRKDTNETVILKGATSDALRHSTNKYVNSDELLRRIGILKESGGNLITFWISYEGYNLRTDLANLVVDYADKSGMYVMFAPAEPYSENMLENREKLMLSIATNFKEKKNVIYGLDSEPFQNWSYVVEQGTRLGKLIRLISPDAILFLPGARGGKYIEQSGNIKFSLQNTIFGTEQYLAADLESLRKLQVKDGYREEYLWQTQKLTDFPVIVTEMGGTYRFDFGSEEDLDVIERMLVNIEIEGFNYQMHSLDNYDSWKVNGVRKDISGLGLFDKSGNLTKKGELFFDFLSKHPGTRIK